MSFLKNKMLRSFGIYTLSNLINSAIPFLLLPILTAYLKPDAYGILTNFNYSVELMVPLIGLNLMSSLQVVYVKQKEEAASYISTGLLFTAGLTVVVLGLFYLLQLPLSTISGIPPSLVVFTGIYAFYQNVSESLLSVWRMEEKAIQYGVFRIARTVVELVVALVLIIQFDLSFKGSIYAMSVSYGAAAVLALVILWRKKLLTKTLHWKHVSHLVKFGAPLIPHVLGSVFIIYTDKLVINTYLGAASNGVYSAGFRIAQVIGLLQNSFNQAWVPYVLNTLKSGAENGKEKIVKWTYVYFVGILAITLLFYWCAPLFFKLLGNAYQEGLSIVLFIALGFAFNGMYKMVSVYYFYFEKTYYIAIVSVVTALLNWALAVYLTPKYGFTGAAISTMTAYLLQFLGTWIWSTRIIKMPWNKWNWSVK